MDHNQTYTEIREIVADALANLDANSDSETLANALRSLAEKFDNLDVWLFSGGTLPNEWNHNR